MTLKSFCWLTQLFKSSFHPNDIKAYVLIFSSFSSFIGYWFHYKSIPISDYQYFMESQNLFHEYSGHLIVRIQYWCSPVVISVQCAQISLDDTFYTFFYRSNIYLKSRRFGLKYDILIHFIPSSFYTNICHKQEIRSYFCFLLAKIVA